MAESETEDLKITSDDQWVNLNILEATVQKEHSPEYITKCNNTIDQLFSRRVLCIRRGSRELELGLIRSYPIVWIGDLFLEESKVRVAIKFIYGDVAVFKDALSPCTVDCPGIKLACKMKLDDVPKNVVTQKTQAETGSCVVIAVPLDLHEEECDRMEKDFISFYERDQSVGVSFFPRNGISEENAESESGTSPIYEKLYSDQFKYQLMIFPPSKFVTENLDAVAPGLRRRLRKDNCPHLMLVISDVFLAIKSYV